MTIKELREAIHRIRSRLYASTDTVPTPARISKAISQLERLANVQTSESSRHVVDSYISDLLTLLTVADGQGDQDSVPKSIEYGDLAVSLIPALSRLPSWSRELVTALRPMLAPNAGAAHPEQTQLERRVHQRVIRVVQDLGYQAEVRVRVPPGRPAREQIVFWFDAALLSQRRVIEVRTRSTSTRVADLLGDIEKAALADFVELVEIVPKTVGRTGAPTREFYSQALSLIRWSLRKHRVLDRVLLIGYD